MTAEEKRLLENARRTKYWNRWGPYLSDRAWGTVREDYSADGTAWDYFPTIMRVREPIAGTRTASAASRDRHQRICFAVALWNGRDPILKERLFGLTGNEGNHGEDVKECYYYLDSHADALVHEVAVQVSAGGVSVRAAGRGEPPARTSCSRSSSCVDTGIFDERPLLRRLRRVRQGDARRHPDRDHRRQSRAGAADAAPAADALVPQYLVVGRRDRRSRCLERRRRRGRRERHLDRANGTYGDAMAVLRRRARAAVHRERNQHAAAVRMPNAHAAT